MKLRYTWSRSAANPVEHIATPDRFGNPICGAVLNVGWQTFADQPSGFAPVCKRCQAKLMAFPQVKPGIYRNELRDLQIERTDDGSGEWVATSRGGTNWITTRTSLRAVKDELNTCGAHYGTGNGSAICKRRFDHPPIHVDKIGHSPERDF